MRAPSRPARVSPVLVLLALAALAIPPSAEAARVWCMRDPVVVLQGTRVQLLVAIPEADEARVTGPVAVDFLVRAGVERRFVEADPGFNGHGYDVAFGTPYRPRAEPPARFRVRVHVRVPIEGRRKVPLRLEAIPDGGAAVVVEGEDAAAGLGLSLVLGGEGGAAGGDGDAGPEPPLPPPPAAGDGGGP